MTNDDIVERLRKNAVFNYRDTYIEAADEIERLRDELDKVRRAWCLYLAANAGLQKEQIANMNGWDCFKEEENNNESSAGNGDSPTAAKSL